MARKFSHRRSFSVIENSKQRCSIVSSFNVKTENVDFSKVVIPNLIEVSPSPWHGFRCLAMVLCIFSCLLVYFVFTAIVEIVTKDRKQIKRPPNIIMIMVEDLGYNDISWNNPSIKTPYLQYFAENGVILDEYYSASHSTVSRLQLMTGIYTHKIYDEVLSNEIKKDCKSSRQKILPMKLKKSGYSTYFIGKKWKFESKSMECVFNITGWSENRAHSERQIQKDENEEDGRYLVNTMTDEAIDILSSSSRSFKPFFMTVSYSAAHSIEDMPAKYFYNRKERNLSYQRKLHLGMVSFIDESFGRIAKTLISRNLTRNTIIIFSSENGAKAHVGSNKPLRGAKYTVYDGAFRVPSFIYFNKMVDSKRIASDLIHVTDWMPTLLAASAYLIEDNNPLDGVDQYPCIIDHGKCLRKSVVLNLDPCHLAYYGKFAVRKNDYKLVVGYPGLHDGWEQDDSLMPTHQLDILKDSTFELFLNISCTIKSVCKENENFQDESSIKGYIASHENAVQLFNIRADPNEQINLAREFPFKVKELLQALFKNYSKCNEESNITPP